MFYRKAVLYLFLILFSAVSEARTLVSAPTLQATNLIFFNASNTSFSVSWNSGNGSSRLVFIAAASSGIPFPLNNTTYAASSSYGTAGTQLGNSGWFCVYNGTGTSVSVTGLANAGAYRVMTLDYNGASGTEQYLTSTGTGDPANFTTPDNTILASGAVNALSTGYGAASAIETFNVSCSYCPSGITLTAPLGFELSTSSLSTSNFSGTLLITGNNSVPVTPVYFRLAASDPVGSYAGAIVSSSPGAAPVNLTLPSSTVTRAVLKIFATTVVKTYGMAIAAGTSGSSAFTTTGLANGDLITSVTTAYSTGTAATVPAGTNTGAITISAYNSGGSFSASNYTVSLVAGDVVINRYPLSVTLTGPLKTYGTAISTSTGSAYFSPLNGVNGEVLTGLTLIPNAAAASSTTAAGQPYTITPSAATGTGGFLASNYLVGYGVYAGTVAPLALTVGVVNQVKVYGMPVASGPVVNSGTLTNFTVSGTTAGGETLTGISLFPDASASNASAAAGTTFTIAGAAATGAGGFLASNYAIVYIGYTGKIAVAPLTITILGPMKSYGTPLVAGPSSNTLNFSSTSTVNGESLTGLTLTPDAAGLSVYTPAASAYSVAGAAATGTSGFLANNYGITYVSLNSTVSPVTLMITATGPLKPYGTVLPTGISSQNFTAYGTIAGESITSVTATPDAAGSSAATAIGSAYTVTPSGAMGTGGFLPSNYTLIYTAYHGTVVLAPLVITALGPLKNYGTALTAGNSSSQSMYSAAGLAPGESVTGLMLSPNVAGLSAGTPAGATYIISPSAPVGTGGFNTANYSITYTQYNGVVGQVPVTVLATGSSKMYGTALSAGSAGSAGFTATGMNAGETITTITLSPDAAGLAANTPNGAAYSLIPSAALGGGGFLAANYLISYLPYNGTVSPAPLQVTANGPMKSFGTALAPVTGPLNFSSSGAVNGEIVTGMTLYPDAYGQSGSTPKGALYQITPVAATGTGGFLASNYTINYIPFSGTVTTTVLTITATGPGRVYGTGLLAAASANNFTVSGLLNGDLVTSITLTPDASGADASAATGSSYVVTPSAATGNTAFLASNYRVNYIPFTGIISPQALIITATGPAKAYHTALTAGSSTSSFTVTGLVPGEAVNSLTLTPDGPGTSALTPAGTAYRVSPSAPVGNASFSAANYTIHFIPYSGAVGTLALLVTATGPDKSYGTVISALAGSSNFTATGMASGETVTGMTLTPDAAGAAAGSSLGTVYTVVPSAPTGGGGFLASNYTVTYLPFIGQVTAQALFIQAIGPLKKYGVALIPGVSTSNYSVTGLAPGERITSVVLTPDAAGASVSTPRSGNYTVAASSATGSSGFQASNYTITYSSYTGSVGSINLVVTATSPAKVYGTALNQGVSVTGFSVSGTQQGEVVTSVSLIPDAAGMSATTSAGRIYSISPGAATGTGGFLASNYQVTYVTFNGSVIPAPMTIQAMGSGKNYGTSLASFSSSTGFNASGAVAGDMVSGITLNPDAAGQSATTPAGAAFMMRPSSARGNASFSASNYTITYLGYSGLVNALPLTVTATPLQKPYGTALLSGVTSLNFTASGMVPGETVTGIMLSPDAAGQAANTPARASYVLTPSLATGMGGFLASNYTVSYIPYTGTVSALTLILTATGPSRIYGTALSLQAGSTDFTASGAVNGDLITSVTLTPDANAMGIQTAAGTHYFVVPSAPVGNTGFLASNYIITYIGYTGTVNAAQLTVNAAGPLKHYFTGLVPGPSASNFIASGAIAGETVTSVVLTPNAAGISAASAPGVVYQVTASGATGMGGFLASNYIIDYGSYTGHVGANNLTITAIGPAKNYGTALTAGQAATGFTLSGTFAGEAVTGVTLTPDAVGIASSTATGTAYTVTVSAPTGNGSFIPANYILSYVPYKGLVTPAPLTITATGPGKTYGLALATGPSTSNFSFAGLENGDQINSVTLTPDMTGGEMYAPLGSGYLVSPSAPVGNPSFLTGNYAITYIPFYGVVGVTSLTITATDPGKVYGNTLAQGLSNHGFTVLGLLKGQQVTGMILTPDADGLAARTAAGTTYTEQPSGATGIGGFVAANYTITYLPFIGTVAPRPLIINASSPGKTYDNTVNASYTFSDNRLPGDIFTINAGPGLFTDKNAAFLKSVTIGGISLDGVSALNYSAPASVMALASILPATADFTARPDSKIYDQSRRSSVIPLASGLIGSDIYTTTSLQTFDNINTGTGKILIPSAIINDGNNGNNYLVSYTPVNTGVINRAVVTVTATASTKVYDNTNLSVAVPIVSGLLGTDVISTLINELYDNSSVGTGKILTASGQVINDGNGGNNYTVKYIPDSMGVISPAILNIAYLSGLTTSAGTLSPVFAPGRPDYSVVVDHSTAWLTVNALTPGSVTSITINGFVVASGSATQTISLVTGLNTIHILVLAQDGITSGSYTLTVNRLGYVDDDLAGLSLSKISLGPVFSSSVLSYSGIADNTIDNTFVSPVLSDTTASMTVNGVAVKSGSSSQVFLYLGVNIISTVVTGSDGYTQKTYLAFIRRDLPLLPVVGSNILTPNGDGKNDNWIVDGILLFPRSWVTVYDRKGRVVFKQQGYSNNWGATYRGVLLPQDTYYYIIDMGNGSSLVKGFITLLR